MSQEVLQTLLGRIPEMDPRSAFLPPEYSRHPVKGRVFPGVIEAKANYNNTERVKGILLSGITPKELEIFDWFEDVAYERCTVNVELQQQASSEDSSSSSSVDDTIDADLYLWKAGDHLLDLESSWSFEDFCTHKLPWYLRSTVQPCRDEYDRQQEQI